MVHVFPNRFAGKVVAITGAASGMGAAMTKRYIAEGAKVLVADICDEAKGQEFVSQFPAGSAYFHQCDVSIPEQATSVVTEAIKQFGDIDIVHNNAASGAVGAITDMDPKTWSHIFAVNVDAPFYISRAAIPAMMKHTADERGNKGVIINTVSISGITPDGGLACYSATKAALANLTKSLAADHARDGIRVNAVAPGPTRSAMSNAALADPVLYEAYTSAIPVKRIGEPEELAAAMMFLASDDASFITVLNVDGGSLAVSRFPDMRGALKGIDDHKFTAVLGSLMCDVGGCFQGYVGAAFGMTRELGRVAIRDGIKCNAIMPGGTSRLTERTPEFHELTKKYMRPEQVAPFVVLLSSEECPVSGEVFNVSGGNAARVTLTTFPGTNQEISEGYLANWDAIMGTPAEAAYLNSTAEVTSYLLKQISGEDQGTIANFGSKLD